MTIKQLNELIMKAEDNTVFSRKEHEVRNFMNGFLRGNKNLNDADLTFALVNEDKNLLLPHEWKTDLDKKKKENKSIRQFVDVVPVDKYKGTFATEAEGNANDELVDFEDEINFELAEQDLKFSGVEWNLKPRGSFTAVPQSLVEDSAVDLTKLFEEKHSEKAVKTENKLVFSAIKKGLETKDLAGVDALNTSLNQDINPALENEIVVITNQDGYEVLKPSLEFFKGEDGQPKPYLDKYPVVTYSNEELSSSEGKVPVIYGSVKRAVKLFDLEKVEMLLVKNPFGLRSRTSVMRGIEYFDVKLIPGVTQTIYAEIAKQ